MMKGWRGRCPFGSATVKSLELGSKFQSMIRESSNRFREKIMRHLGL